MVGHMTVHTDDEAFARDVVPALYMRVPTRDPAVITAVIEAGRRVSDDVLFGMLTTDAWRDRKVGAWLAICRPDAQTTAAVLNSLRTSQGTYTAFSLAVAAIELAGADAAPALLEYGRADVANGWYGAGFISEALAHLGLGSPFPAPSERDTGVFAEHLATAAAIAARVDQGD